MSTKTPTKTKTQKITKKKTPPKKKDVSEEVKTAPKKESSQKIKGYIEAIGRRKTSGARARIFEDSGEIKIKINEQDLQKYFPTDELRKIVVSPFKKIKQETGFSVTVHVSGGGIHSQAEAVRHALSRALVKYDIELRKKLKRAGFLKRDPRMKERRKFGLKKARKAPQWSKR